MTTHSLYLSFSYLLLCLWLCLLSTSILAQAAPNPAEPLGTAEVSPLFATAEPIEVTLLADWTRLTRDRRAEPDDYPALLSLSDNDGQSAALSLKVRPRGKSRRLKTNCDFPPLRLNFDRGSPTLASTVFANQNKLKLVTHCAKLGNRRSTYSDRLHSEYLLYRIYALLTPASFQVRRLTINYAQASRSAASPEANLRAEAAGRTHQHPAFVIEHKKALAKRTGRALAEVPAVRIDALDNAQASLGALFAYFAGNTDFSFTRGPEADRCCHNAILLGQSASVYPVPYDFDATGFVDPPYALPAAGLRLHTVTQRRFRGFCAHQQSIASGVARFAALKDAIYELLTTYPDISEQRRRKLLRYTDEFYATLERPQQLERRITRQCR